MIKKTIVCATAFAFLAGFAVVSPVMASDAGPAEMTLQATVDAASKPKPAVFPHKKHQDTIKCAECHHGAADGKQVAYTEGMAIAKCESCHNKAAGLDKKISTFKNAAHAKCKGCHKAEKKGPTKCSGCHK